MSKDVKARKLGGRVNNGKKFNGKKSNGKKSKNETKSTNETGNCMKTLNVSVYQLLTM